VRQAHVQSRNAALRLGIPAMLFLQGAAMVSIPAVPVVGCP